jgi:hypothetical protein
MGFFQGVTNYQHQQSSVSLAMNQPLGHYLAATKHLFDCLSAKTMEIGSFFRKKEEE